jgi:hypothetical protein
VSRLRELQKRLRRRNCGSKNVAFIVSGTKHDPQDA